MQTVINVFQDYKTSLAGYEEHFDNILQFKRIVGSQNCILEANGDFRFGKYIGCVMWGNTCLQILPKIFAGPAIPGSKAEIQAALAFVYRLLCWTDYLQVKALDDVSVAANMDTLLEIIIYLFITRFLGLYKRDIYREYAAREEEQLYIRGKILFAGSVLTQLRKSGYLMVRYDEFSTNNKINRIIKTTMHKLLFMTRNVENKKKLQLGLSYLAEVEPIALNRELFNSIVYTRMNEMYRPVLKLAELLFTGGQPGLLYGEHNTLAFLVPLNLLFEAFFYKILTDIYRGNQRVHYHSKRHLAEDSQGNRYFRIEPDFVVYRQQKCLLILDTKYKNPFDGDGNLEIGSADLYQICTYALCYDCPAVYLVYPLFMGQKQREPMLQYTLPGSSRKYSLKIMQVDITLASYPDIVNAVKACLPEEPTNA